MSSLSVLFRWFAGGSFKYPISNSPICSLSSKSTASFKFFTSIFRRQVSSNSISPPWLMLPPAFEGGGGALMRHNFYSLTENKVITLAGTGAKEITDVMMMSKPPINHHRVIRGSSHGWLALFDELNLDLFLYNPISGRHIKLPPIHNLPANNGYPTRSVAKVILSCSPDQDYENCRAVITYNCTGLMAFCCPGRSKEWTHFGRFPVGYDDCVYSSEHHLLFGLTNIDDCLETWDLRDPSSPPRMIKSSILDDDSEDDDDDSESGNLPSDFCRTVEHLVVADHHLFVVSRYIMECVGPDGSYVDCYDEGSHDCPHMTVDFDVHKYNPEKGSVTYVDSLEGLALFIGLESHTVALPAAHFPAGLKPNSIYFTDTIGTGYWTLPRHGYSEYEAPFGGHDIGIFNYENKTVSSCYYPCDLQSVHKILPSPMWFFPSSPL
ncbi:hypothetical protein CASFOL_033129 [Castilleja foliolosa]|uniref:KIB1-4 beta-propeller domain-containing protein n=1 Tax=Castilleja foliolosa TaxID=1961234 RepID=A0ABD3C3I0_9LAMI